MTSALIGCGLFAALFLSFFWWLAALSKENKRRREQLDKRNDRIDAQFLLNVEKARQLGIYTDDLQRRDTP